MESNTPKKVIIGMSGGVDSSTTAALLKKEGHFVIGVFLIFWSEKGNKTISKTNKCCPAESLMQARKVSQILDIPFYTVNCTTEFKKAVVDYFISEYKAGRTPNPCVVCNEEIKFKIMLEKAKKLGCNYVATGHYARIKSKVVNKKRVCNLLKAKDKDKDQSYFLYRLKQRELKHILFPIGDYTKEEVRSLAKKFSLPIFDKEESQGICFVREKRHNEFLKRYLKEKEGNVIAQKGEILGKHSGLWKYTIGQREGIGISFGKPLYVISKNLKKNELIVTSDPLDSKLYPKKLIAKKVNWVSGIPKKFPLKTMAKIRYKHPAEKAEILKEKEKYIVRFEKPQRAVTSGQSVVFYKKDRVLGGGIITQ